MVLHNESNVGYPAGCNQALEQAQGQYVVFLNNDAVVTPGWLEGLIGWSLSDWPNVGLVGPVSNGAPDVGYVEASARRRKLERNLRLLELDYADRPEDGFTLFNLGWTLLDLGRTAEALRHLQQALVQTRPSSSTLRKLYHLLAQDASALGPRVLLSQVLLQEGREWAAAERALRDVLAIDPNHAETRHNLRLLLRRLGREAAASDGESGRARSLTGKADRPRGSLAVPQR